MTRPVFWLNGRLAAPGEAALPLTDHGLLYGDGVFEGIRFYNHRPFRLGPHLERLEDSARAIALALPYDRATLETAVAELVDAFGAPDGYIRLVATRGSGSLGLDPGRCERANLFMIADRVSLADDARRERGIAMITANLRRPGPDVLDPRIKSLNYLNNILAKIEARQAGADEAVLLDARGRVAEATAANVFIARGGRLLTPPVTDGALDGITRKAVLELCEKAGIPAQPRSLAPLDLYTADEGFLCGTGAELIPVRRVDGRALSACPGPLTRRIQGAYHRLVETETGRA